MKYAIVLSLFMVLAGCGGGGSGGGGDSTDPVPSGSDSGSGDGGTSDGGGTGDSGSGSGDTAGDGSGTGGDSSGDTTTEPDPVNAPAELAVTGVNGNSITLQWVDMSDNEQEFVIERKLDGGTFSRVTAVTADVEQYTDSGLAYETTYVYRIYAANSDVVSEYSNQATVTTGEQFAANAWIRTYPGASGAITPKELLALGGGQYLVVGESNFQTQYFRLDQYGQVVWAKEFTQAENGGKVEFGGVVAASDGNPVFLLNVRRYTDIYQKKLIKVNAADGSKLWEKHLEDDAYTSEPTFSELEALDEDRDGVTDGFVAVARQNAVEDFFDIVKVSSQGELVWSKRYTVDVLGVPADVLQVADGSIYVAFDRAESSKLPQLFKLDAYGNLLYQRKYPVLDANYHFSARLAEVTDPDNPAEVLLVGTADFDPEAAVDLRPVVVALDSLGNISSSYRYTQSVAYGDVRRVIPTPGGDIWMLGSGAGGYWVSKMGPDGLIQQHLSVAVSAEFYGESIAVAADGEPVVLSKNGFTEHNSMPERGDLAVWRFAPVQSFAFRDGYSGTITDEPAEQESATLQMPQETTLVGETGPYSSKALDLTPAVDYAVDVITIANGTM
ncbi:fibronectin type III domain-containing protein [Microbulbifer sp. YPW16]|uniref:fibronectin type III domain-containing protein n=1 Tax=unclassified Microbulbifer TaxID=2619833 RepID=UPI001E616971|nr:fibronectin type III domain-containing protein [Microbulbifer sp. YPW16]UHQ56870.1 fibronectin type III domain-containing protein [Microbulbifer sp. YPW16]